MSERCPSCTQPPRSGPLPWIAGVSRSGEVEAAQLACAAFGHVAQCGCAGRVLSHRLLPGAFVLLRRRMPRMEAVEAPPARGTARARRTISVRRHPVPADDRPHSHPPPHPGPALGGLGRRLLRAAVRRSADAGRRLLASRSEPLRPAAARSPATPPDRTCRGCRPRRPTAPTAPHANHALPRHLSEKPGAHRVRW